jgi:membrane protease YdiL (CAAX protease family)
MKQRHDPTRLSIMFVVLAFASSWICWVPVAAADHGIGFAPSTATSLLVVLGTFGPFCAAATIVGRTAGASGLRAFLSQAFRWRANPLWYAAALLAPFGIRVAVITIHVLKGGTFPDLTSVSMWISVPSTFLIVLLIGGPTGEEFGWRGFLLQRMQSKIGLLAASLVIGVIQSFWHIPLFFITGTAQSHLPFALFAVRTVSLSVISTWLYNGTRRSLLFVLLFHASQNTWPNSLFLLESEGTIGPYVSSTLIYAGWACQLFLFGLTKGRADRRQARQTAPEVAA